MRTYRSWIGMALALAVFTALPAGIAHPAEHWGHYGPEHGDGRSGGGWRGDVESWHGGHWFHGDHLGRLGWWWVVGDGWYFYPAPVYPYPDPYAVAPSANYWYYCASAGAYYPYVSQCPEGWQPVMPEASES